MKRFFALLMIIGLTVLPVLGCAPEAPPASDAASQSDVAQTSQAPALLAAVRTSEEPNFLLLISDEPNDIGDFAELWVTISGVGFVLGDEEGIVEETFEPVDVNLVGLTGDAAVALWSGYVPDGSYTKVFLYVDAVWGLLVDDDEEAGFEIKLPSNKLQIQMPIEVEGEGPTDFVFDISILRAGNSGQYILKPQLTESGQGMAYRIHEEAQERIHSGRPEWAGRPDWAGKPETSGSPAAAGKGVEPPGADAGRPSDQPGQEGDVPSIDVVKEARAIEGAVVSTITIINSGDVDATVVTVTDTVYWQIRRGDWQYLTEHVDEMGYTIAAGDSLTLTYEIPGDVPAEARELRNVVEVVIEGRDKVFRDIVSFMPWGYMPEIEFEGVVDSLDPLTITTGDGDTYVVLIDADTNMEGELVVGGPVRVEGVLQSDATVLASEIEGPEEDE